MGIFTDGDIGYGNTHYYLCWLNGIFFIRDGYSAYERYIRMGVPVKCDDITLTDTKPDKAMEWVDLPVHRFVFDDKTKINVAYRDKDLPCKEEDRMQFVLDYIDNFKAYSNCIV